MKRIASKGLRKPGHLGTLEGQATEQDSTLSDTCGGIVELPGGTGPSEVPEPEDLFRQVLEDAPPASETPGMGSGASPHGTKRREPASPVGSPGSPQPLLAAKRPRTLPNPRMQQQAAVSSSTGPASQTVASARHTETRRARPPVSYAVLNGGDDESPPPSPERPEPELPRIRSAPRQSRSRRVPPAGSSRPLAQAAPLSRNPDNGALPPRMQSPVPAVGNGLPGDLSQGLAPHALIMHMQQQAIFRYQLMAMMQQLYHANPQTAVTDPVVQNLYAQYVCSLQTVPMTQAYMAAMAQARVPCSLHNESVPGWLCAIELFGDPESHLLGWRWRAREGA